MLVPADRRFVEIDENLFRFEIFLEAPGTKLAAEPRLFVAAPGRFDVRRLHVIHPNDPGAERLHHAERFVNVAGPDRCGEAVRRVVSDANGVSFAVKWNHGRDRAKYFFAGDARGVVHIVENRRLDVVAFAELLGAAAADGYLRFFFAEFEIGTDPVVLFLADERAHFRFAFARRANLDSLGFFGHGLDEFRINFLFDKDAAARRTDFALIDEHAEERAVNGRFPISVGEEDV